MCVCLCASLCLCVCGECLVCGASVGCVLHVGCVCVCGGGHVCMVYGVYKILRPVIPQKIIFILKGKGKGC